MVTEFLLYWKLYMILHGLFSAYFWKKNETKTDIPSLKTAAHSLVVLVVHPLIPPVLLEEVHYLILLVLLRAVHPLVLLVEALLIVVLPILILLVAVLLA